MNRPMTCEDIFGVEQMDTFRTVTLEAENNNELVEVSTDNNLYPL